MQYQDRSVVVTGSGRGIGAETARRFAAAGARVVVADIHGPSAQKTAAAIEGALAVEVDVTSRADLRDMVQTVTSEFGGIDVLINNAMSCSEAAFLEQSAEDVARDFAVTVMGPYFACQEVIPGMVERGGGVILNVSSVNASSYFGNPSYSAAKAGLESLTKTIAVEFGAAGIRCNAVAPGSIATEYWEERRARDPLIFEKVAKWYPLGRVGRPDDIADALLFLASDAASWITGVVLPVDGGILAGNLAMTRDITAKSGHPGEG
jgi:meso-butanediol dehydrogenase / (S,S)-butanediol dehydrogenase / diacetyl reductase